MHVEKNFWKYSINEASQKPKNMETPLFLGGQTNYIDEMARITGHSQVNFNKFLLLQIYILWAYPWLSRPDLRNFSYHQLSFLSLITTIQPILRNAAEIVVERDVSPLESNRSDTFPIVLQIETPKEDEKRDRLPS